MPDGIVLKGDIAIDTEAMGLNITRDRLCVVQLTDGNGDIYVVHFPKAEYHSPNLKSYLVDEKICKIMHFARFDVSIMQHYFNIEIKNIFCTKISSRLVRTYTEYHGLKDLCSELLGVKLSKQQQSSDWGQDELSSEQIEYAASDVAHLHELRDKFVSLLNREARMDLAQACFDFLPIRAKLDVKGWAEFDIFRH